MTEKETTARLVAAIRSTGDKLVLAESCTGGLASSLITQISGVSDCFCGSAVTYLDQVKSDWLNVKGTSIQEFTAVSEQVAREMATGILQNTTSATIGAAITGHVGPGAPPDLDGVVFVSFMRKKRASSDPKVSRVKLSSRERVSRQIEAAEVLFEFVMKQLDSERMPLRNG